MAHSICASFSPIPALSIPWFASHLVRSNTKPVHRPVRTAQKLSLSPRRLIPILAFNSSFALSTPVIKPHDHWSVWTALFSSAAFGIWSQKTKWGSALSGALVSILIGLAASSVGLIPSDAPAYGVVFGYMLPVGVSLLLLRADLRRVVRSTGALLVAFLLGSGLLVPFPVAHIRIEQSNMHMCLAFLYMFLKSPDLSLLALAQDKLLLAV